MNKNDKFFWCMIIVLAAVRILMQNGTPLYGIGTSSQDDMLLVRYALSILNGDGLGEYDLYTLNKMPMYSIFLAFCSIIHLPYQIAIGLFYSIACIVFLLAFRKVINNKICLLIAYVFLLFSPVMFDIFIGKRIYRMAIVPAETIMLVSSISAIYLYRNEGVKKIIPWSVLSAISLLMFYFTREDSFWILSFVLVATFFTITKTLIASKNNWQSAIKIIICAILPIILLLTCVNLYKLYNYKTYGVYATTDFNDTYFKDFCRDLTLIENDYEIEGVTVTYSAIQKAYLASPTFATLAFDIDNYLYQSVWETKGIHGEDGEIEKDYILWGIREVVAMNGYYSNNAAETNDFYKQIHLEFTEAFENGSLPKKNAISISHLVRPFEYEHFLDIVLCWIESIENTINFSKCNVMTAASTRPVENLRTMELLTNSTLIYPNEIILSGSGWGYLKNGNSIKLAISDNVTTVQLDMLESPDLVEYFKMNQKNNSLNVEQNRFKFYENFSGDCYLLIYDKELLIDKVLLSQDEKKYTTSEYEIYFDDIKLTIKENTMGQLYDSSTDLISGLVKLYSVLGYLINIIGLLAYALITCMLVVNKKVRKSYFDIWLVLTGLFMSFLLVEGIVSYSYTVAYNRASRFQYLAAAYPLIQMFSIIAVITIFKISCKK